MSHIQITDQPSSEQTIQSCGWKTEHQVYSEIEQDLFTVVNSLGKGSLGVVEEVRLSPGYSSIVRKRVQLPYHARKTYLNIIKEEAAVLRSLDHPHIVKVIGSYQDGISTSRQFYSLLMFPVGDQDLKVYLEMVGGDTCFQNQDTAKSVLKKWFKCLSSALEYMQDQGVRHQDIKPSNIIRRGDEIYFTDFSSSSRFDVGNTTSTENPARGSDMYAAPEVFHPDGYLQRHGRGADVFALGAVFCEMFAVVTGRSVHHFHEFLSQTEKTDRGRASAPWRSHLLYSRLTDRIKEYFADNPFYIECVKGMLATERNERPSASRVATIMENHRFWDQIACSCDSRSIVTST
jgi:serine/threonine protein kinase